ncbi:hypothetical protein [Duganella levis]|uniref:hypothetical protein n=1 Tax=Duganella levis TaxID=2692169 RepID=UPI003530EB57
MQLYLMAGGGDFRRQHAHRIIAEVIPLRRLHKKRRLHAMPAEAIEQKIQSLRPSADLATHHLRAHRPPRRIGKRPGDAELRIDCYAHAHGGHPATAIRPV